MQPPPHPRLRHALIALMTIAVPGFAQTLYVDADANGMNNGSSWCNAYVNLQDALAAAASSGGAVAEIHVASGVYRPDRGSGQSVGDRTATFRLVNGVRLMGGYAGCGASNPDVRNFTTYETTLSGDLIGNDGPDFSNRTDNTYHVVTNDDPTTTNTTVLDGFTIRSGHADGLLSSKTDQGPGLHNFDGVNPFTGQPTVRNCLFIDNWAANHGALNDHGGATIIDCTFRDNFAAIWGGALYIHDGLSTAVTGCNFVNNKAQGVTGGGGGGGAVVNGGSGTFTNCRFEDNISLTNGGAIYNQGNASPTFEGCVFARNAGVKGGGVYDIAIPAISFTQCTFNDNTASDVGGAVYDQGTWSVWMFMTFDECVFQRNVAQSGGGIYLSSTGPRPHDLTIRNSSFVANQAIGPDVGSGYVGGGALWFQGVNIVRATDTIFLQNSAVTGAGAIYSTFTTVEPDEGGFYVNCKFIGNTARYGGAMSIYRDNSLFVNCLFSGNHAVGDTFRGGGGAISNYQDAGTTNLIGIRMYNCTLIGNTSGGKGGVFHMELPFSILRLHNSIFWGNTHLGGVEGGEEAVFSEGIVPPDITIDHSIVQGWTGLLGGAGNFGDDPLLANALGGDGIPGTADDQGLLTENSPAVDSGEASELTFDITDLDQDGDTAELTPLDLDHRERIVGSALDIGAFEFCTVTQRYADVDGSGRADFTDISLVVAVFQSTPTSITPDEADVFPCGGDGLVNFQDINATVTAFQGSPVCPDMCQ